MSITEGVGGRTHSVESLCQKLRHQFGRADVFLPGGNRGDGLIYEGAKVIFERVSLETFFFRKASHPPLQSSHLIVCGSGGFGKHYHRLVEIVPRLAAVYPFVILFPSTFDTSFGPVRDFLHQLPENMVVFARERKSFADLSRILPKPRLHLDHDTAIHFDYSPWSAQQHKTTERIFVFRRDREKSCQPVPINNHDISAGKARNWKKMLDKLSTVSVVHTNRAHVGIAAAKIGLQTHIYPSCYFKQEAIYNFSLAHLPNVVFHPQQPIQWNTPEASSGG